eukprot:82362-Lingulodinium_polyedra.AAC.1
MLSGEPRLVAAGAVADMSFGRARAKREDAPGLVARAVTDARVSSASVGEDSGLLWGKMWVARAGMPAE